MKKGLIGLLILLLSALVQSAYGAAGDVASINGKAITAVATVAGKAYAAILTIGGKPCADRDCTYTQKDTNATGANSMVVGYASTGLRMGNSFTSGSAYTLKKVALSLKKVGTGGFTSFTINVCADSTDVPGACTVVGTQTVADLTTDFVTHEYVYATGYSISNATNYWIVLIADGEGDGSNYVGAARNGAGSMAQAYWNGSVWTVNDTSSDIVFTTYSCE